MQALIFIANLTFTIVVTCVRFSHSGKVCSGDYLFDVMAEYDREKGPLVVEGHFLYIFVCAGWILFAIMGAVLILQICITDGKNSPDKERDL